MKAKFLLIPLAILGIGCSNLNDKEYHLHILSTNDLHSSLFDSTYVSNITDQSIFAVNHYIDSLRQVKGRDNVILLDVGDCLQGDNSAYYYNYVDTVSPHLFPRMAAYMDYDAVIVGNHDIETGHSVYDRVATELKAHDIAFLGGNAIRTSEGKPYFPLYKIVKRGGLKVAIIGYTNANIKAWLTEGLWSGMDFKKIAEVVQDDVDAIRKKERPNVVIVAMHSGTGEGNGTMLESEGLDVFNSVKGVDFVFCAHDHKTYTQVSNGSCIINAGSHARFLGHGTITINVENGVITKKELEAEIVNIEKEKTDVEMRLAFQKDYDAVKAFTIRGIGELQEEIRTRDAFAGMCDYINLIHTVSLSCSPAQISFASPLTYNGYIKAGQLVYNDLFTIYPFENQLFVVSMTGAEIKSYLEHSYDSWINTISSPDQHLLKIKEREDQRTGQTRWSFVARSYNFDSAGGLVYDVDVTKPMGERVQIKTMASGEAFDEANSYNVAMTSYRASGGGNLMSQVGIDTQNIDSRVVERYPEIRQVIYDYIKANGTISPDKIGNPAIIGNWNFVPKNLSDKALKTDMDLLFKR